jgi:DNA-binding transcriptional MerR regulator
MGTKEAQYTLKELSACLGIEPRTIRSYIQQGLLRGPLTQGRNARYDGHHLKRLRVIKRLKDEYGLQLSEIRRILLTAGDDEQSIEALASRKEAESFPSQPESPLSTLAYIQRVKGRGSAVDHSSPPLSSIKQDESSKLGHLFKHISTNENSPIGNVLSVLKHGTGKDKVGRNCRGKEWVHIEITPDIVLMVRGAFGLSDIALLEQASDFIRHIIMGGGADGK